MRQRTTRQRLRALLGLLLTLALFLLPAVTVPAWSAPATPAAPVAVLTIADGDAAVLRDTSRFAAAEGLRLRADDIVVTAAGARLVRIELDDGNTLDLGPSTQVMLQPRALARDGSAGATAYLLQGWAKLTAPPAKTGTTGASAAAVLATPRADAAEVAGTLIAHLGADQMWLFAESGSAALQKRRDGKTAALQTLKDGDSYLQTATGPAKVSRLPPSDLRGQVPRAFVDTLPRRADRFAGRQVEAARPTEVTYADMAAWINGEPALRGAFVQRLTPRSRDSVFRHALVADMKLHPEWKPVLFPPPPKKPAPPRVLPQLPGDPPTALADVSAAAPMAQAASAAP